MGSAANGRPLAVVTGASSGIGKEIARELVDRRYDVVIAAEEPEIHVAARELDHDVASVRAVQVDLAEPEGVEQLADAADGNGRPIDVLVINAGIGVSGPFVETDLDAHLRLIALNVEGAVRLAGLLMPAMVRRGSGHVMFTSSIAAAMSGPRMATYNASKVFLGSFAQALHQELKGSGVTV